MKLRLRGMESTWEVTEGLSLGRLPSNDVCLDDTSVSREHAKVEKRADGFWLVDLNSSNGIQGNGRKQKEFALRPGDSITVGSLALDVVGELAPQASVEKERSRMKAELRQRPRSSGFGDLSQQPMFVRLLIYLAAVGVMAGVILGVRFLSSTIAPS